MNEREVIPLKQGLDFELVLPGSKSITNRALLCAALAKGKSKIYGALESDDTLVMMEALKKLGINTKRMKDAIEISGCGQKFEKKGKITLDLHNAGTATRFLTAIMAVREGDTVITGDKRMQERPIADLIGGLEQLGADITYLGKKGCPPLKISNVQCPMSNAKEFLVRMNGDKSSQYFSALLMLGPLLKKPLRIELIGDLVSKPYIDITLAVMKAFGVKVKNNDYRSFVVKPQQYKLTDYHIEGDASAASYWTAMAHLHKGKVKFENLSRQSIQGDSKFIDVLNKFQIRNPNSLNPKKSEISNLKSEINMVDMPDVAMTAAVTALFVKGQTKITGLSTLRIKETDRLDALEKELGKVGVEVKTTKDSITIQGLRTKDYGLSRNTAIQTYNDHRMAMCFAVVGTKISGIVIENPGCTDKTYPNFWEDLERAYLHPVKLGQKNLVLTGMRGSGKTFLGKKIARLLKRKFIDMDEEIEKDHKMKISEIVKCYGWPYFRNFEQKICSKFADAKHLVIATGGGVVLNPKNMKALKKNGVNVFIFADSSVLSDRIKHCKNRPTIKGKNHVDELQSVWLERRELYLKYADFVWDNTSGEVVEENLKELFKP